MSKNIVISGNTYNGVSTIKAQNAGGGTSSFVDLSELEQTKTEALNMASGNQVVTPDSNKVLTSVTITKPDTLVAGNIKKDVVIGGVVGTLEMGDDDATYQEINNTEYGVSSLSFSMVDINGTTHNIIYKDGMTWAEFISSTAAGVRDIGLIGTNIYYRKNTDLLYTDINHTTLVVSSDNIISNAVYYVYKSVIMPAKGDLLNINMDGTGNVQSFRVLKNVNGTVYEVVALNATGNIVKVQDRDTPYAASPLDVELNTTYYNTLSATAKAAIVNKTINVYRYTYNASVRNENTHCSYADYSTKTLRESSLVRHVYALDVEDIENYFNHVFGLKQIAEMMNNCSDVVSSSPNAMLLRSTAPSSTASYVYPHAWYIAASYNMSWQQSNSDSYAKPAFQIDLSKIDFDKLVSA